MILSYRRCPFTPFSLRLSYLLIPTLSMGKWTFRLSDPWNDLSGPSHFFDHNCLGFSLFQSFFHMTFSCLFLQYFPFFKSMAIKILPETRQKCLICDSIIITNLFLTCKIGSGLWMQLFLLTPAASTFPHLSSLKNVPVGSAVLWLLYLLIAAPLPDRLLRRPEAFRDGLLHSSRHI